MNYNVYLERLLEMLKADESFAKKINEFRIGDAGDGADKEKMGNAYPLCYVTTAPNPEVTRESVTTTPGRTLPGQRRIYEFWVVIVVLGPTPKDTQAKLHELDEECKDILGNNIQMRDTDGNNPLCAKATVMDQRRHEKWRGNLVEAVTVRFRPIVNVPNTSYITTEQN